MRRLAITVPAAAGLLMIAEPAMAHGMGGRQDLPVPLEYFVVGAGLVLVLSFVALAVLWPEPRWQEPVPGRAIRGGWLRPAMLIGGAIGVAGLALVVAAGLFGVDNPARNPSPVVVFVGFWLVLPFLSALIGDLYPLFDPWSRLARWLHLGREERTDLAVKVGLRPAVAAFVAFTWLELVAPDAAPQTLTVAAVVYTGYLLLAAEWAGRGVATASFDGFAAYNRLLGAIGPLDLHGPRPRWRGWLRGLPALEERPGLTAMVIAMIGTVTYDGASATVWWEDTIGSVFGSALTGGLGLPRMATDVIAGTVGLLGVTALIGLGYLGACAIAARLAGTGMAGRQVAGRFAHTLVPIGFAYAFAHYFTLIVFEGQYLLSTISDPFGRGWDLFGTAGRPVDFTLVGPTTVWWIQVAVILAGHLAGVVLAHDRALADFPPETAVRSQYAMLGLMVFLTGLGLTILAAG